MLGFSRFFPSMLMAVGMGLTTAAVSPRPALSETQYTFSFGAITEDYLGRSEAYGTLPFDGISLRSQFGFGRLGLDFTIAQTVRGTEKAIPFYDLSYRFANDNWKIGAGQIQRHWSPSEHTSLILSRNAPAFPAAYIAKTNPTVTDLPVLRAFGPWEGEFLVGKTSDPSQPDNALFMGARFAFQPVRGLDVELVRTAQWGGDGQPSGLDVFWDVLTGNTNEGGSSAANQMAGLGLSYQLQRTTMPVRIYAQAIGEDESGGLPSCFMYLAGFEFETRIFGANSTVTLETVDTRVDETGGGFCGPNTAYNNTLYPYLNEGSVMGAAIDSESQSTKLYVTHELSNMSVNWGIGYYKINDASNAAHRLSSTATSGVIVTLGASKEMFGGRVNGVLAYQGFDLDTADLDEGLRVGLNFSKSF
ncbi:MAG: capsule assembly Wzi family protein [Sulfitobacter sp.]